MAGAIPVFATIAAQYDNAIATGVTQTVSTALQANATVLTSLLTIFVIILGCLTMFGRVSMAEFTFAMSRAAIISLLLTATYFNQFIQEPAMNTIPNWIAQSMGSGAANGPQQFDQLRSDVITHEAAILQQATGFTMIAERIETGLITLLIVVELGLSFILWELARGLMGLLIATAPFLIGLYLFNATRSIALNLAGGVVTVLIMQLMLSVMVSIEISADNAFMQMASTGGGVDVQIDVMINIAVFFFFGVVMTVLIPTIAARIGGGVVPNVGGLVSTPLRALSRLGRKKGD